MRPAGIHHVAICVDDAEAAKAFYCDVLGFTPLTTRPAEFGPGHWLDAGGQQLHLMQVADAGRRNPGHFALRVDDIDARVADISAAGREGRPDPAHPRRRSAGVPPRPRRQHDRAQPARLDGYAPRVVA